MSLPDSPPRRARRRPRASQMWVNVAALAFLGTTVGGALSGALALVAGGLVLLSVGLERGRRMLLDWMGEAGGIDEPDRSIHT